MQLLQFLGMTALKTVSARSNLHEGALKNDWIANDNTCGARWCSSIGERLFELDLADDIHLRLLSNRLQCYLIRTLATVLRVHSV